MKRNFYKMFFSAVLLMAILSPAVRSQDFHLSQYDAHPQYVNPALTGMNVGEDWPWRFNLNYRQQWNKMLNSPYASMASGFDIPLKNKFSIGEFIMNNRSPDGLFNTFNLMLSGSYQLSKKEFRAPHHLCVGLQFGMLQKSVNPSNFLFDAQYSPDDPDGFDQKLPTGEKLSGESLFGFDANVGFFYKYLNENKVLSPFFGFAVYHITRPNESFADILSETPMRFNLHGGFYCWVNDEFRVLPQFLLMRQAEVDEINLGVHILYQVGDSGYEPMLGIAWRSEDALIFHAGIRQNNMTLRFSYDANTSYLKNYSQGSGSPEFSIIITGKAKSKKAVQENPGKEGILVPPPPVIEEK